MYRINQNQEVVRMLLKLKDIEEDYPVRLFSYRRTSFMMLIARYIGALVRFWSTADLLLVFSESQIQNNIVVFAQVKTKTPRVKFGEFS